MKDIIAIIDYLKENPKEARKTIVEGILTLVIIFLINFIVALMLL